MAFSWKRTVRGEGDALWVPPLRSAGWLLATQSHLIRSKLLSVVGGEPFTCLGCKRPGHRGWGSLGAGRRPSVCLRLKHGVSTVSPRRTGAHRPV